MPEKESYVSRNGLVPPEIRTAFIKKVYCILAAELAWTTGIVAVFMYWEPLRMASVGFVKNHPTAFQIVSFAALLPTLCALMCLKNRYPLNLYLTLLFMTAMGAYVGVICALYYAAGMGIAILQAFVVTAVIFISLSIYCHVSKADFSYMGGYLFVSLVSLSFLGFFAIITGSSVLIFFYQCAGVLIFSCFILYDTSQIIHKYGPDDYIIASIDLYLDIINLFLYLLSLLGNR